VVAAEVVACGAATGVVSLASMSSSRSFTRVVTSWRIASMNAMKRRKIPTTHATTVSPSWVSVLRGSRRASLSEHAGLRQFPLGEL